MTTLSVLHTNWWMLALRGLFAAVLGLLTFLAPGLTLLVLITWFGVYCLVNGVLVLVTAFRRSREQPRWWALVLEGVASLVAGGLAVWWPAATSLLLLYLVAVWAILTGVLQIGTAIRLRKQLTGEWMLVGNGLLSIVFGGLLLLAPLTGLVLVSWWLGAYAFVAGIMQGVLAFRLRRAQAGAAGAAAS